MLILPLASEPFTCPPTATCSRPNAASSSAPTAPACSATPAASDGPAMSVVYYVPTDTDELLVSTMRDRGKAKAVARNPKVSLCVLDERWPFTYLQVYCDATVDDDPDLVVDVMMAVGGRMSGEPLGDDARPFVAAMAEEEGRVVLRCRPYRPSPPAPPPPPQRPGGADHPLGLRLRFCGTRPIRRDHPDGDQERHIGLHSRPRRSQ